MRIYVPASLDELDGIGAGGSPALWTVTPRQVHTVTPELAAELPEEDTEGLEYEAFLDAAAGSTALLAARPDAPPLRVVVTVEVPDDAVASPGDDRGVLVDLPASALRLVRAVEDVPVVCVHADEPAAGPDAAAFRAAADADDDESLAEAFARLGERDLLWYDSSEISSIPR